MRKKSNIALITFALFSLFTSVAYADGEPDPAAVARIQEQMRLKLLLKRLTYDFELITDKAREVVWAVKTYSDTNNEHSTKNVETMRSPELQPSELCTFIGQLSYQVKVHTRGAFSGYDPLAGNLAIQTRLADIVRNCTFLEMYCYQTKSSRDDRIPYLSEVEPTTKAILQANEEIRAIIKTPSIQTINGRT